MLRVAIDCQNGRDLPKRLALIRDGTLGRSNFFESLKSKRCLHMVEDVAERLRQRRLGDRPDPFAAFFGAGWV